MKRLAFSVAVAFVSLLAGCSSDSNSATTGTSGNGATGSGGAGGAGSGASSSQSGIASTSSGAGGEAFCDSMVVKGAGDKLTVNSVTGTVTDVSGAPMADQDVQVCGTNYCEYGKTNG